MQIRDLEYLRDILWRIIEIRISIDFYCYPSNKKLLLSFKMTLNSRILCHSNSNGADMLPGKLFSEKKFFNVLRYDMKTQHTHVHQPQPLLITENIYFHSLIFTKCKYHHNNWSSGVPIPTNICPKIHILCCVYPCIWIMLFSQLLSQIKQTVYISYKKKSKKISSNSENYNFILWNHETVQIF